MFRAVFAIVLIPSILPAQLPLAAGSPDVAAIEVAVADRARPALPPEADPVTEGEESSLAAAITLLLAGSFLVGGAMTARRWRRSALRSTGARPAATTVATPSLNAKSQVPGATGQTASSAL